MKRIFLLLLMVAAFQSLNAQFNGTLRYVSSYTDAWFGSKGEVQTIIHVSGSQVRIDAFDTSFSKQTVTRQNPLLIDLSKATETHLVPRTFQAIIYSMASRQKMIQVAETQTHTVYDFKTIGQEKVQGFNCTHYQITKRYATSKTMKPATFDIWITKDLGSCNVWYVGKYLYYFAPMNMYLQLAAKGADGVVVQWQEAAGTKTSCVLTGYDKKAPTSDVFTVPSSYSLQDLSNY